MSWPEWTSPDGRIRIICGDSLQVLSALPDGCAGALLTDPPYSSGGMVRGDRTASTRTKYVSTDAQHDTPDFTGDNRDQRAYLAWCSLWMLECSRLVRPGGLCGVFTDWRQLPTTTDAIQAGGWVWRGIAVWQKVNARPMLGRYTNQCEYVVWGSNGPRAIEGRAAAGAIVASSPSNDEREHITQKPVEVMEWLLKPIEDDAVILDPFGGSGTTAVACIRNWRSCIVVEKLPHNFQIAVERCKAEYAKTALFSQEQVA